MIVAVIYGKTYAPFVDTIAEHLCRAVHALGRTAKAVCLEDAIAQRNVYPEVERVHVLPFDADSPTEAAHRLGRVFPAAHPLVPFAVQELCWDKLSTQERLVSHGVPVPDTLVTNDPSEVRDFVRRHRFAILKERSGCAGMGHWVAWEEDLVLFVDNGFQAYQLALQEGPASIAEGRLSLPPPYYVQKLVGTYDAGQFAPGQILRAYIVDNEVRFWTERYRDAYRRPGHWIINVSRGAKYRFLLEVSEQTRKTALRAARAVRAPVAAVDIVRTAATGPLVLEVDTDSYRMCIDRSFKRLPEYRDYFDLDVYIGTVLAKGEFVARARGLRARQTAARQRTRGKR